MVVGLLVGVAVAVGQCLLQARRFRVEERDRPDGQLARRHSRERRAQCGGAVEGHQAVCLGLEVAQLDGDLGDDAGDPLCVGDQVGEVVSGELADLARRQDDARGGDVVLEHAVLVGAEARATLGEPAGHRGRGGR